jgi:putative membrane protein
MRYLGWVLKFLLFILLLGFAVKNSEVVTLAYYLGYEWQAPLVLIILMFFVGGAVVGVAACMGYLLRQRRELVRLRKLMETTQITLPDEMQAN